MNRRLRRALLTLRESGLGPGSVDLDARIRGDAALARFARDLQRLDTALGEGASAPIPEPSALRRASILRAVRRERDRAMEASSSSRGSAGLLWAGAGLTAAAALVIVWALALRPPAPPPPGALAQAPPATLPGLPEAPRRIADPARVAKTVIEDPLREEARRLARDGRRAAAMVLAAWRGAPSLAQSPAPSAGPSR